MGEIDNFVFIDRIQIHCSCGWDNYYRNFKGFLKGPANCPDCNAPHQEFEDFTSFIKEELEEEVARLRGALEEISNDDYTHSHTIEYIDKILTPQKDGE